MATAMVPPLTSFEIIDIFGVLRGLLAERQKVSANQARTIAGEAGFDLGSIPDGLDLNGLTRRAPVLSGIDGQWASFDDSRRAAILPRLAKSLSRHFNAKGEGNLVNERLADIGFRFENGSFVPVNALGQIPQ